MFLLSDPAADNRHDQPDQSIEMHQLESSTEPGPAQAADNDNLFENNPGHDNNRDRAESPAKDETLEQESDDELFINEGPSLDDDDDDSYPEHTGAFPRDTFDDSSNFVDEEETTYGSPGLREAFNEGYGGNSQDRDRAGSADNGRKNKRKQFKPRNIIYSLNEESEETEARLGRNSHNSERENSPMDLSVGPGPGQPSQESDSDSESSQAAGQEDQTKPKPGGLSVVRPEILFGNNKVPSPPSSASNPSTGSTDLNPLSLLSNLTGIPPGLNPLSSFKSFDEGTSNAMRDAFKEVLKLYGVSSDAAENLIANNDQSRPGKKIPEKTFRPDQGQQFRPVAPASQPGLVVSRSPLDIMITPCRPGKY